MNRRVAALVMYAALLPLSDGVVAAEAAAAELPQVAVPEGLHDIWRGCMQTQHGPAPVDLLLNADGGRMTFFMGGGESASGLREIELTETEISFQVSLDTPDGMLTVRYTAAPPEDREGALAGTFSTRSDDREVAQGAWSVARAELVEGDPCAQPR